LPLRGLARTRKRNKSVSLLARSGNVKAPHRCWSAAGTPTCRGSTPNTVAFVQKSTESPGDSARALRGKSGTLLLHFRWKHKEISPVSVPRGRSKTVESGAKQTVLGGTPLCRWMPHPRKRRRSRRTPILSPPKCVLFASRPALHRFSRRWDASAPHGIASSRAHCISSPPVTNPLLSGGRSGCSRLPRISHTRSTAACSFPSRRRCACSVLGQDVPIQPFVPRGARLATPGNSRASSRNV
jgi:hypothetical protein